MREQLAGLILGGAALLYLLAVGAVVAVVVLLIPRKLGHVRAGVVVGLLTVAVAAPFVWLNRVKHEGEAKRQAVADEVRQQCSTARVTINGSVSAREYFMDQRYVDIASSGGGGDLGRALLFMLREGIDVLEVPTRKTHFPPSELIRQDPSAEKPFIRLALVPGHEARCADMERWLSMDQELYAVLRRAGLPANACFGFELLDKPTIPQRVTVRIAGGGAGGLSRHEVELRAGDEQRALMVEFFEQARLRQRGCNEAHLQEFRSAVRSPGSAFARKPERVVLAAAGEPTPATDEDLRSLRWIRRVEPGRSLGMAPGGMVWVGHPSSERTAGGRVGDPVDHGRYAIHVLLGRELLEAPVALKGVRVSWVSGLGMADGRVAVVMTSSGQAQGTHRFLFELDLRTRQIRALRLTPAQFEALQAEQPKAEQPVAERKVPS